MLQIFLETPYIFGAIFSAAWYEGSVYLNPDISTFQKVDSFVCFAKEGLEVSLLRRVTVNNSARPDCENAGDVLPSPVCTAWVRLSLDVDAQRIIFQVQQEVRTHSQYHVACSLICQRLGVIVFLTE